MTLSALIQKGGLAQVATATFATVATQAGERGGTVARVATVAVANSPTVEGITARRWRIHFPNRAPVEVLFAPDVTPVEVAAIYLGARIEPQRDPPQITATPAEEAELRELVAQTFADDTEHHWAEALAAALADPEGALTSFRLLAAEGNDG